MRQPLTKGKQGTASRSLEAPILLTAPFAVLALASFRAGGPFTATRWLGSSLLLGMCIGSYAAGLKRTRPHITIGGSEQTLSEAVSKGTAFSSARVIGIETERLTQPLTLSGRSHRAQLRIALVIGAIAGAALIVVACLLIGQVQRAGPVSTFSAILSVVLVTAPAALALHLANTQILVQFAPEHVRVVNRNGLIGVAYSEWEIGEIESVRLVAPPSGAPVRLVLEGRTRTLTLPLWGLQLERAEALLTRAYQSL